MSVTGTQNTISFNTDGTTSFFNYPYYLFQPSDMDVTYAQIGAPSSIPLVLNSDYRLIGTPDNFGAYPSGIGLQTLINGVVTPFPSGGVLVLTRSTEETQQIQYVDGDKFPAMKHEHALDKLTLEIQDIKMGFRGFYPSAPPGTPSLNDWFIVYPAVAGTFWGYIFTTTGWKPFAPISF